MPARATPVRRAGRRGMRLCTSRCRARPVNESLLGSVHPGLLAYQAVRREPEPPRSDGAILRGRGLELVDDQGRLRAQLQVVPANTTFKMPDGTTGYPETVIFRLITPDGKPRVKLTTS